MPTDPLYVSLRRIGLAWAEDISAPPESDDDLERAAKELEHQLMVVRELQRARKERHAD